MSTGTTIVERSTGPAAVPWGTAATAAFVIGVIELGELLLGRGDQLAWVWDVAALAIASVSGLALLRSRLTAREAAADALRRVDAARERARALADASPTAVILHRAGEIVDANDAVSRMLSLSREELLSLHVVDLFGLDARPALLAWLRRRTGEPLETTGRRRDGSPLRLRLRPADAGTGEPQALLLEDIEPAESLEQQLRAARTAAEAGSRTKSTFLANMSHEIRTPMSAVIGMSELLLESGLSSEQRAITETIRSSSEALLVIINDVLELSKLDAGKLQLADAPFDPVACVEGVIQLFALRSNRSVELVGSFDESVPAMIYGDGARLRQVLVNLVGNALKFTESGEVVVGVEARREPEHQLLCFEVRDTGIGIPRARADALFESFAQADSSVTRKYGGTGLGLTICKRLVELMGGSIWFESEEGVGSTFRFVISARTAVASAPPEPSPLRGKRMLVVEAKETARRYLVQLGRRWGMETTAFAAVAEARAWLARHPVDVVVLSERPGETAPSERLTALVDATGETPTPCVLLVPPGDPRVAEETGRGGAVACLARSIHPPLLRATLVSTLDGARARRDAAVSRAPALAAARPLELLVADDNVVNVKMLQIMLERMGYRPDVAADGHQVLAALARKPYDLVLMDVQMPGLDGLEATRRIRASDGPQPRIVAVTASTQASDQQACMEAGMDDFISKPIRREELVALLRRVGPLADPGDPR